MSHLHIHLVLFSKEHNVEIKLIEEMQGPFQQFPFQLYE